MKPGDVPQKKPIESPAGPPDQDAGPAPSPADWQREADRVAAREFAPPGVLINDHLDILQFRGQVDPYLAHAPGASATDLGKLTQAGLFPVIYAAIAECRKTSAAVRRANVRVPGGKADRQFDLQILPLRLPQAGERCYLVLFDEGLRRPSGREGKDADPAPETDSPYDEVDRLEAELASNREYLRSVIERQEVTNEELRSANEEIRTGYEELEASKEKLQSVNKQLTTVNEQLQAGTMEMTRLSDDLTNLLASANVPKVVLGPDLRIRRFTPAAGKLLHLLADDLGRPIGDLNLNLELPDLGAMAAEVIESVQAREHEVRDQNGRWYLFRMHPYRTSDNRIDGVVMVLLDIDAMKRAEKALRNSAEYTQAIVDTVREPLLILDADLRVRSANPAFYRVFRAEPRDTEGMLMYDLGNRQWDIPALRVLLEEVLKNDTAFDEFEVRHDFDGIGSKVMMLNARRILRDGADTEMILLAIEDHTEEKMLQDEQDRHVRELSEIDRYRTEFLAVLAHELRNPLAPVRNAVQILRRTSDDPEVVQSTCDIVDRQIAHLARLVDDLLDAARIRSGRLDLHQERVDLAAVLERSAVTARSLAAAKDQELTFDLPPQAVYLMADPIRLAQVVENLVSNAIKFSDRGAHVAVTAGVENRQAVIRVRDQGIGLAADQLARIFEMFVQVDTSLERAVSGLGIGLALARQIVDLHGGTLTAESEGLGKGSTFTLTLPLAADQSAPVEKERTAPAEEALAAKRVLIVDDNQDAARSLGMLLERAGHVVNTAFDGVQALKMAEKTRPEIVLLDIGLPKLNGYEVAREIRSRKWGTGMVLVALTGWGLEEDRYRASQAGFNGHLVKPVTYEDLMRFFREPEDEPAGQEKKG